MSKSATLGKVEFWTAAVELFRDSGLNCKEFCNREGLSYFTFCRWRDKLGRQVDVDTGLSNSGGLARDYVCDKSAKSGMPDGPGRSSEIDKCDQPAVFQVLDKSVDAGKSKSPAEDAKFVSAGVIAAEVSDGTVFKESVGEVAEEYAVAKCGKAKAGIEVRFPSGVLINVDRGFDRAAFKDVVSILGAGLC